ncbi:MAG TPA: hypothetical protein VF623_07460 [Segetibacter sp.]
MITSLSTYELQLVSDAEVLLSKNKIIQTVYAIFGDLAEVYKSELHSSNFNVADLNNAKISRGENYIGLPFVMLDYPRQFNKQNFFAIRSFFWWGNFFSITLHLSGTFLQEYNSAIQNNLEELNDSGWLISAAGEQWQHHFEADNYSVIDINTTDIKSRSFIKLAKKIPLSEWDSVNIFYKKNFKSLIAMLTN